MQLKNSVSIRYSNRHFVAIVVQVRSCRPEILRAGKDGKDEEKEDNDEQT